MRQARAALDALASDTRRERVAELWPDVLALVVFTAAMMAAAVPRFRKQIA